MRSVEVVHIPMGLLHHQMSPNTVSKEVTSAVQFNSSERNHLRMIYHHCSEVMCKFKASQHQSFLVS